MEGYTKVIVNPAAGAHSTYRKWPEICRLLQSCGLSFDYDFTDGKGHAIEIARNAAGNGYRFLVAVGGDGTIHEVANGILETENGSETTLGIICTGTGSDLSRSIGISREASLSCLSLKAFHQRKIDVGRVTYERDGQAHSRYFVNSAGIGFDAAVVDATERLPKYGGGTLPYLVGLARSFLHYRNKTVVLTVNGQKMHPQRVLSIVVANGAYFGGGMRVAPEAKTDDGLFDVVTVGDFGKLELLRVFPRVYKGTHLSYPKIDLIKGTVVTVTSAESFLLHADGELLGNGPVSFELLPRALNLVT
jgi:diacylglycerol kinase (ATP)